MNSITLRMSDEENELIRDYAKANNITISELMRKAVLEKIESEIDLDIYNDTMKEHKEDPQEISFDDMLKDLKSNE